MEMEGVSLSSILVKDAMMDKAGNCPGGDDRSKEDEVQVFNCKLIVVRPARGHRKLHGVACGFQLGAGPSTKPAGASGTKWHAHSWNLGCTHRRITRLAHTALGPFEVNHPCLGSGSQDISHQWWNDVSPNSGLRVQMITYLDWRRMYTSV